MQTLKDIYGEFTYNKIKKIDNKDIVEAHDYHGSFIALFPKTLGYQKSSAEIELKISFLDASKKPDYLIFRVDGKILEADNAFIGIDRLKIENPTELEKITITCKNKIKLIPGSNDKEEFTSNKKIEVYAAKKQGEGKDDIETLAGCITMVAPVVKNLDVAIVGVKTKPTVVGVQPQYGAPVQDWLAFFKKALGQSLIKVNIIEKHNNQPITIDVSATSGFSTTYEVAANGAIGKSEGTGNVTLKQLLHTKFESDYATIPNNCFKLFFMDVACAESGEDFGKILGFSNYGWDCGLMFVGHTTATIAHECLHAMDLSHSFFHYKSRSVFKAMQTYNIMDYSHMTVDPVTGNARTPKTRYYTWKWQWDAVRSYSLLS